MKDTTLSASLHLPNEALLFDLNALYACLQTIPDHRDRRGVRYPLASLLMVGVLAKLAGQDGFRGMAHWAKLRTKECACHWGIENGLHHRRDVTSAAKTTLRFVWAMRRKCWRSSTLSCLDSLLDKVRPMSLMPGAILPVISIKRSSGRVA